MEKLHFGNGLVLQPHVSLANVEAEVAESSNPIDYAKDNPFKASGWIIGAVALGLAVNKLISMPGPR